MARYHDKSAIEQWHPLRQPSKKPCDRQSRTTREILRKIVSRLVEAGELAASREDDNNNDHHQFFPTDRKPPLKGGCSGTDRMRRRETHKIQLESMLMIVKRLFCGCS